jgi:hypothetical protein
MVVMTPREKWTDERLDDLNEKVDKGFEKTEKALAETKAEMREGFANVHADIRALNGRFDALNRNLLIGAVAIIAALIGSNVALISVIAS